MHGRGIGGRCGRRVGRGGMRGVVGRRRSRRRAFGGIGVVGWRVCGVVATDVMARRDGWDAEVGLGGQV